MKAIIQTELVCTCCKRPMQWSTAIDIVAGERVETDYVACRSLKCEERNVRYQQPTVELVDTDAPMTATECLKSKDEFIAANKEEFEALFEAAQNEVLQPLIDRVEELIIKAANPLVEAAHIDSSDAIGFRGAIGMATAEAAKPKPKRKYTRKDVKG